MFIIDSHTLDLAIYHLKIKIILVFLQVRLSRRSFLVRIKLNWVDKRSIVSMKPTENRKNNLIRRALCQLANKSSSKFNRLIHLVICWLTLGGDGGQSKIFNSMFYHTIRCWHKRQAKILIEKTLQKTLFIIDISQPFMSMLFERFSFYCLLALCSKITK